jgi:hypothetical protein
MMNQMTARLEVTEGVMVFGWFKKKPSEAPTKSVAVAELPPEPLTEPAPLAPTPVEVGPIPQDKIAARAYEIWVQGGKRSGTGLQDWLQAEAQLRYELQTQAAEPLPKQPR